MITSEEFLANLKTTDLATGERYDNKILAEWNNAQTKCAICGEKAKCDNSHTVKKGRGGNLASQVYALPLCRLCHKEYESVSIEKYLIAHPNLFEIVTRHIEKWADYFTGREKPEPKKAKVPNKPKPNTIFKKFKNRNDGLEYCKKCKLPSYPKDEDRHKASCIFFST